VCDLCDLCDDFENLTPSSECFYDDFSIMSFTIREHDDEYHNNNKAAALLLSHLFQRANGDSKGLGHGHQSNSSR